MFFRFYYRKNIKILVKISKFPKILNTFLGRDKKIIPYLSAASVLLYLLFKASYDLKDEQEGIKIKYFITQRGKIIMSFFFKGTFRRLKDESLMISVEIQLQVPERDIYV